MTSGQGTESGPTQNIPAPSRGDRVRTGCAGAVLYFPFYLLLIFLLPPLSKPVGDRAVGLLISYPGVAVLWFVCVSIPLTIVFGQTAGQKIGRLFVVRKGGGQPPRRPGPLRAVAHVALFVILFPIDWLPWLFGRSRLVHEMVAGTQVVSTPPEDEVQVHLRTWIALFGGLCFAYVLIVLVANWNDVYHAQSPIRSFLALLVLPIALVLIFVIGGLLLVLLAGLAEWIRMSPNATEETSNEPEDVDGLVR